MIANYRKIIIFVVLTLNLIGCATTPTLLPPKPEAAPMFYHRLEKGQTLWTVSKIYNVSLDELLAANHIQDTANIEAGRLIFIPGAQTERLAPAAAAMHEDFIWPVKGKVISSFGQALNNMPNKGIDIQPQANLDVVAARSGRVIFYHPGFKGFGKTIIIDHLDGFLTVYCRNAEVFIKPGDSVERGRLIAKAGPYAHFEIRRGHAPQNPYFYLP